MRQVEPRVLDISPLDAVDRYPVILRYFDRIGVGERLWIMTDREPGLFKRRLRLDRSTAFRWDFARQDKRLWIVVITKVRETREEAAEGRSYWRNVTEPVIDHLPMGTVPAPAAPRPPSLYEQLRGSGLAAGDADGAD